MAGKIGKDSFIRLQDISFFRLVSFPIILTTTLELPMPPAISQPSSDAGLNLTLFTIPQFLLLQMGTASILLLLLAEKASGETLQAIGEASEELFRGDRLPLLNFPIQNDFKQ